MTSRHPCLVRAFVTYTVKEIFYTLQGEGAQAGRPAVFCRFAGCNLWSGRASERATAQCDFCDTDFVGTDGTAGGKYASAAELATRINQHWPSTDPTHKYVVCTGGEPLLQLDRALIDALHAQAFTIAIETNGTLRAPAGIDWICVSPKADLALAQTRGDELKVVYPQAKTNLAALAALEFQHFFIQPMRVIGDPSATQANLSAAIAYCLAHPQWHLSLQTHTMIGLR